MAYIHFVPRFNEKKRWKAWFLLLYPRLQMKFLIVSILVLFFCFTFAANKEEHDCNQNQ